jgi:cell surface protein SprA
MRNYALERGWLVGRNLRDPANTTDDDPYYNRIYAHNHFEKLDVKATITPFKSFDINILANRTYTGNMSEQMDVVFDDDNPQLRFNPGLLAETGNFTMSYLMLETFFDDPDILFDRFKQNRNIIAQRLLDEADNPAMNINGFGPTSQQVILPAFLSAYSGQSVNKIKLNPFLKVPLPNWNIRYRGLMKLKWFKKHFKNFSLSHGYRSSYSILNFQNNMQYNEADPLAVDNTGNYLNKKLYTNVSLIDEFSPLIKVDIKLKNSLSFNLRMNSDRMLTLNMNNNTLSQNTGKEYVIGLGYRIKNLPFSIRLKGNKQKFKGDLNMKLDLSLRQDKMMVRYFGLENAAENDQITGGQTAYGIKFIADYALTKNLQAGVYYLQDATSYQVSTSFDRRSISSGISVTSRPPLSTTVRLRSSTL